MLVSNTMRFGTDNTGDFTPLPRMKLLLNGKTTDIKLTDFPISSPCIAVRINGGIFYMWLVSPNDAVASQIRVKIGGQTYAVANTA